MLAWGQKTRRRLVFFVMDENERHREISLPTLRFLIAAALGRALPGYVPVPGSGILPTLWKMGGIGHSHWWSLLLTG